DIAAEVRRSDPVCTGIGCDHPAATCELDHTIPYWMNRYRPDGTPLPHGETSIDNLRPRDSCCHHLKDNPDTGWTIEPHTPGQTKTTTPPAAPTSTPKTPNPTPSKTNAPAHLCSHRFYFDHRVTRLQAQRGRVTLIWGM
ncbi:hypothetical protein LPN03_20160, partial [Arthrobacter sp. A2-55]|nr:hypothetical protein [Arthrobacter sp. A2-55]